MQTPFDQIIKCSLFIFFFFVVVGFFCLFVLHSKGRLNQTELHDINFALWSMQSLRLSHNHHWFFSVKNSLTSRGKYWPTFNSGKQYVPSWSIMTNSFHSTLVETLIITILLMFQKQFGTKIFCIDFLVKEERLYWQRWISNIIGRHIWKNLN